MNSKPTRVTSNVAASVMKDVTGTACVLKLPIDVMIDVLSLLEFR